MSRALKSHGKVKKISRKCGKVRFKDEIEAMIALSRIFTKSRESNVPCRYYRCPMCAGFHLTSQSRGNGNFR